MDNTNNSKVIYWVAGTISLFLTLPISILTSNFLKETTQEITVIQPDLTLIANAIEEVDEPAELMAQKENMKQATTKSLINQFQLIKPSSNKLCETNNPWLLGEKVINSDEFLSGQSCFAIKFNLHESSNIMLISKDINGQVYKLLPNSCQHYISHQYTEARQVISVPQTTDGQLSVFAIDEVEGEETFFLLAYDQYIDLNQHNSLFENIFDICSDGDTVKNDTQLENILKSLRSSNPTNFDWKKITFYH